MKILFTGASSFSGLWFAQELIRAGHEIVCCFQSAQLAYCDLRKERIEQLLPLLTRAKFECCFGSNSFFELIQSEKKWDLLCHHAADVTHYKSPEFDVPRALANNTHCLKQVLECLKNKDCHKVVLTGSAFEQQEGDGIAVSPYGLSKGLTSDVFHYYCHQLRIALGKFVIPNPFGPYEEMRFTSYLVKSWIAGEIPKVNTPNYVRDNIPVSLLAKSYVAFAEQLKTGFEKYKPSFYAESQADFTCRFATAMRSCLQLPCAYELMQQTDFSEPLVRINSELLNPAAFYWDEAQFWQDLATYYKLKFL